MTWSMGPLQDAFEEVSRRLEAEHTARRIWSADASLWTQDPSAADEVRNRLGWLHLPETGAGILGEVERVVRRLRKDGFTQAILLGMGGSSLAPDVLRRTLASPGGMRFHVLDSTDPAVVARAAQASIAEKTLVIVSSKSGTTAEPLACLDLLWYQQEQILGVAPTDRVVVVSDPGTPLTARAVDESFRHAFAGASDVGGRFSALSVANLFPARLMGVDAAAMLAGGRRMARQCRGRDVHRNPGLALGAALGAAGLGGRDKITLLADAPWDALGDWIEQLIAESSGKDGKGLIPVVGEPLRSPQAYGADRLFVYLRTRGDHDAALAGIEAAGMPCLVLDLEANALGLGEAFFRWEFAVATACHVLGVNAFDQPHVQSAKQRANEALAVLARDGALPALPVAWRSPGVTLSAPPGFSEDLSGLDLPRVLRRIVQQARPGEALVLLGFLDPEGEGGRALTACRDAISFPPYPAVTLGFGPRYLHSTGQLHKGGANNLVVLMVTAEASPDLQTPGHPISFGLLERAQAMGDLQALWGAGRRAFGLHVDDPAILAGLPEGLSR